MQHETQNSKVPQHPVEFLQPLQLNSKLEVEFLSQQPFVKMLFFGQIYPIFLNSNFKSKFQFQFWISRHIPSEQKSKKESKHQ